MSVQRYELSNWEDDGYELVQATDGEYMKYSDYAALEAQLAAVTAERDSVRRDFDALAQRNSDVVDALKAATERAEKAEAALRNLVRYAELVEFSCLSDSCGCTGSCRPNEVHEVFTSIADVPDANAVVAAFAKSMREVVRRAKASGGVKANARAVAHWAECEAWRGHHKNPGTYWWLQVLEAREASDRARNPILEPPTQGGENPGAV